MSNYSFKDSNYRKYDVCLVINATSLIKKTNADRRVEVEYKGQSLSKTNTVWLYTSWTEKLNYPLMLLWSGGRQSRVQMELCFLCVWVKCQTESNAGSHESVDSGSATKTTIAVINLQRRRRRKKKDITGIKIRAGERLKPPMAAICSRAWFRSPRRERRKEKEKTFGSHARCCCNDRECEGVGNISHHAYIKLYCNRGTICDRVSNRPSSSPNPLGFHCLKGSVQPNYKKTPTCLGTIFFSKSSSIMSVDYPDLQGRCVWKEM